VLFKSFPPICVAILISEYIAFYRHVNVSIFLVCIFLVFHVHHPKDSQVPHQCINLVFAYNIVSENLLASLLVLPKMISTIWMKPD